MQGSEGSWCILLVPVGSPLPILVKITDNVGYTGRVMGFCLVLLASLNCRPAGSKNVYMNLS